MELYRKAGARYFVAQAVHCDNFDLWDSKFHRWNAVQMGPKRDMVGTWEQAALKQGLRFGVSEHLGYSRCWFQTSHGADKHGPFAGVPYDGTDARLSTLYHPSDPLDCCRYSNAPDWHREWFNRIKDLVDHYQPDLLYSDGGIPFGEVGRSLVAHFYNESIRTHGGQLAAVYTCKLMQNSGDFVQGVSVQDVERGAMREIQPLPWQTDTSNGDWYFRENDRYKTAAQVVRLLADIVSKNGNMLLNIVQYPDGSLPPQSAKLLEELAAWMRTNGEAIHGTRPWKVYGEGPTVVAGGHFKEEFPFTAQDIRFTTKGGRLYAIVLGLPHQKVHIRSLAGEPIAAVSLLGSVENPIWKQDADGTVIESPAKLPCEHAVTFRITLRKP
jgi:alpha-L-fucosidase